MPVDSEKRLTDNAENGFIYVSFADDIVFYLNMDSERRLLGFCQ